MTTLFRKSLKSFLTCLPLVLCSMTVDSATTFLRGSAPGYAGRQISFNSYSDMISYHQVSLAECMVNDSGYFSCTLELNETRLIFTTLGLYNCYFFAEPGVTYELHLPARTERSDDEALNPYYEPSRVHIAVKQTDRDGNIILPENGEGLNFLIRAFNDTFKPLYYKYVVNAASEGRGGIDTDRDLAGLIAPFDSIPNQYFNEYMKYRIGLLKHFVSKKNIARDYLSQDTPRLCNPAYMELFNEVYNDYFTNLSGGHPDWNIPGLINRERNYARIGRLMEKDPDLRNRELRELVQIKGFYDGFYSDEFSGKALLALLDSVSVNSPFEEIRNCAAGISRQVTRLRPGYPPPPFTLTDQDSNLVSLRDFEGEYVYLGFCNSYSYNCIKDFELVRALSRNHKEHLRIVTIITDADLENMQHLVEKNRYDWTFLHYGRQPQVVTDYEARVQPAWFLIGPDGKLILSPAPGPGQEFESALFRIMRSKGDL